MTGRSLHCTACLKCTTLHGVGMQVNFHYDRTFHLVFASLMSCTVSCMQHDQGVQYVQYLSVLRASWGFSKPRLLELQMCYKRATPKLTYNGDRSCLLYSVCTLPHCRHFVYVGDGYGRWWACVTSICSVHRPPRFLASRIWVLMG